MKNIFIGVAVWLILVVSAGCVPMLVGGIVGYAILEEDRRHDEWMMREQMRLDEIRRQEQWSRWHRHGWGY